VNLKTKDAILNLLTERAPNFVNENVIRSRLAKYKEDAINEAIEELVSTDRIEKQIDERKEIGRPVQYYRFKSFENIPIRDTIKVGEVEIPRILSWASHRFFPEDYNETVERLAEYTDSLEKRFSDLVKEEQRKYWARIISVFGVFVSILSFVLVGLPKIQTDPSLPFWNVFLFNLAQILPLAAVLALFVIVLRIVIR
jgi:hypothetical protein